MKTLNYFLIAIFALLYSCDTNKSHTPEVYNFLLSQPDGTIPDDGFAIVCEKQIDSTTGFNTISVPVSDTIFWEGDRFCWTDNRDSKIRPLQVKVYSPDDYTPFSERLITKDVTSSSCELLLPQTRPIEVIIRNDENHLSNTDAWALIITPTNDPLIEIEGASSVSTSQFHDFSLSESSKITLNSEALFNDYSPMYCHLFRFDGVIWHKSKTMEADIESAQGKIRLHLEHTSSCYE